MRLCCNRGSNSQNDDGWTYDFLRETSDAAAMIRIHDIT